MPKLSWRTTGPDARNVGAAEAEKRGDTVYATKVETRDGTYDHRVYQTDGKWWVSGVFTNTPMCANTPDEAKALLEAHYERELNLAAWQEYMATHAPPSEG